jgi:hypothetical protein
MKERKSEGGGSFSIIENKHFGLVFAKTVYKFGHWFEWNLPPQWFDQNLFD